ncbi:MAG: DMT family transporter [Pseudomonadales bacterium]|nr:DMT family transporter [Pseudomonadales bacterium]
MTPIYLTLASVFLYSAASIIRKKISADDDNLNYMYTVLFQIAGGIAVIFFSIVLGFGNEYIGYFTTITPQMTLKIFIGAILWFSATFTSFKALNSITASKYSIIETLSPLVSIVLALLLLGETFTQQQLFGTLLILVSVFAVVHDKETKLSHFSRGEGIAFLSVLLSGLALVNDKGIYQTLALSPTLAILFILPGLLAILVKPTEIKKIKIIKKNRAIIKQLFIMSMIWGIAAILYYKAIVLSNSISLIVSVGQLSVILTVILGFIFLKETDNWKIKIIASLISVVGLIFMSI